MGSVVAEGDFTQVGGGHNEIHVIHHNHNHHHVTNNNPHYTINVINNTTSSQQEQNSISASGDLQQVMHSLHNILQSASHVSDTPTQCEPCRAYHARGHQPVVAENTTVPEITNIERILDRYGKEILPGDCVQYQDTGVYGIYLGRGEMVRADSRTQIVVKEKLDIKRPIITVDLLTFGDPFPREQRVQRALQCIGRKCPVREECGGLDFVYWVYTED